MSYTIESIAKIIGAERVGCATATIDWILTDSRSLCFPEETLFFAIRTKRNDGHHYIADLYRRGTRNFVVNELPEEVASYENTNFLVVKDTLTALQTLAAHHRSEFNIPVVGVTGSNGKTMVKEWLYQLISPSKEVTRSPRSYNSQTGVPLSVWLLNEQSQVGIFEAGISQGGEMERLQKIIRPTIGVFTHLGSAHQENFSSMEEKCMEKLLLFKGVDVLIYNGDDEMVTDCVAKSMLTNVKEFTWSRTDTDAPLYISKVKKEADGTEISYHYLGTGYDDTIRIPFVDDASVEDAIHCLAVCLYLLIPQEDIKERMARLDPVAMRLEVKEGRRGCTVINDSYNADIDSLDIALDFMNRRPSKKEQSHTLIISDILQTGEKASSLYRKLSQLATKRGIQKLIGVGEDISSCAKMFSMESYFFKSTEELLSSDVLKDMHDELVLIKGSRKFHFDRVSDVLVKKVHETILEINLNAVVDNLNYYRSFLKEGTKMVCMVKASAYGAGAVEIAKTLQDHRVDYLAVAVADEGVELRKNGITGNIMIMNPEMTAFKTMFEYHLEPEVYSFRWLDALIKAAEKEGVTNFPCHIKLDTGMHRLGFDPEKDMPELIDRLTHQTAIMPRSVFSHFVGTDEDKFDDFTRHQFALYDKASLQLQAAFKHKILRHICNTCGIERFPEYHMDMVRLGLGLYGIDPHGNRLLHPISTLKTTILQIRNVPEEDTVGYSRKGVLTRDSRIAAIPIGYADGLHRALGNGRCYCLVNGRKAPYVGNICMDVCMIDVTDIPCEEGDSVEIFGKDLPVTVLSDTMQTIPYEILTGISERVKRVYYQD